MSDHSIPVVEVLLSPHPNADSLSIVSVGAFTCCVRSADWKDGMLAAYIPPDSVVDTMRPEFAFLAGHERIRVKRLRGVISMGLLVPAPLGMAVGDNAAEALNVSHYEPPIPADTGGESAKPPSGWRPVYDVENIRRYPTIILPGELVTVSEKLHGASGRWCFDGGVFHCGSRTEWKRESDTNLWWRAFRQTPELADILRDRPEMTIYGEVYGQVQDLKYGAAPGEVRVGVFDVLDGARWIDGNEARDRYSRLPWVPLLYRGPFDLNAVLALAEGKTLAGGGHVREGCVVKPQTERACIEIGRVQLKAVGSGYLERA